MKRFIISIALLMLAFTVPAFAAEGGTYDVKYMAANLQEVYNQIAATEFPDGVTSISRPPASLEKDTTAYVSCEEETRTVTIRAIKPTFEARSIPAIYADSQHNQSALALADYVYQYLSLIHI